REVTHFVVVDRGRIVSVIPRTLASSVVSTDAARRLSDIGGVEFTCIRSNSTLLDLLTRMRRHRVTVAVVVAAKGGRAHPAGAPQVAGVLTKADVAESLAEGMELFAD